MSAYKYGINTDSNVLQILPNTNLLYGAIALVTLQLCLSHAVGSSALFQNIEEYLKIPKCNWNSVDPIEVLNKFSFAFQISIGKDVYYVHL